MPPIKGRMMGRMSRAGQSASSVDRLKALGLPRKKARMHLQHGNSSKGVGDTSQKDERLKRLRIPDSICKVLPSVKRFKGSRSFVDLTDDAASTHSEESSVSWEEKPLSRQILGIKRAPRGNVTTKYFVRPFVEDTFNGMIWDLAIRPDGEECLVSCGDGVLICNIKLELKHKLDNIILAGGVSYLSDGRIAAVCRNSDSVNIYSPEGVHERSFESGNSPMTVAATCADELIVCDPGEKCVRLFSCEGELLHKYGPELDGFKMRWPLYSSAGLKGSFFVTDCHSQKILKFDREGSLITCRLSTGQASEVLRPHGLCLHNDLFIIDTATDTLEVFTPFDTFIQTLIPSEEGHYLRPKVVSVNNTHLAIGGLAGIVKVFQFVSEAELELKTPKKEVKTPAKTPSKRRKRTPKVEIKDETLKIEEVIEIKEEVILDEDDDDECGALVIDFKENGPPVLEREPATVTRKLAFDEECADDPIEDQETPNLENEASEPVVLLDSSDEEEGNDEQEKSDEGKKENSTQGIERDEQECDKSIETIAIDDSDEEEMVEDEEKEKTVEDEEKEKTVENGESHLDLENGHVSEEEKEKEEEVKTNGDIEKEVEKIEEVVDFSEPNMIFDADGNEIPLAIATKLSKPLVNGMNNGSEEVIVLDEDEL